MAEMFCVGGGNTILKWILDFIKTFVQVYHLPG